MLRVMLYCSTIMSTFMCDSQLPVPDSVKPEKSKRWSLPLRERVSATPKGLCSLIGIYEQAK